MSKGLVFAGFVVVAAGLASAPQHADAQTESARTYCARVGNDDQLRPLRSELVADARRLFNIGSYLPTEFVATSTFMRCMNGKAWLCYVGANLACAKAEVSRTSEGADAYCRQNPDATGVPMSATGHATLFSWKCVGSKAKVDQQIEHADPRGFLSENWLELR
jgi:hypothetical protein